MRLLRTLAQAAGLSLCAFAFTGSAFADPGNGNSYGNDGTPPGQAQKAEQQAAAAAAAPAPAPQAAHGQATKEENAAKAETKAAAKAEVKAQAKTKAAATAQTKSHGQAAVKASESKGRSAEAHHHVIICHRTGSDSNPYVVINIPWTAWSEAHSHETGSHPDLNGRHDILLKDPASRPGSKDGFTKGSCGATVAVTPTVQVQPQATVDVCPNLAELQATVPVGLVLDAHGNCVASAAAVAAKTEVAVETKAKAAPAAQAQAKAKAGAVLGAATPGQAAGEEAQGGVLGAVASAPEAIEETATTGTLPFTGIPLWIAGLLGCALLATGIALRRAGQH